MSLHSIEAYQRDDGKWSWRVTVGDDVIASDASQGYERKKDCLHSLFGLWFGTWDESFLALYQEWQSYAGEAYEVPPEAQAGPPVHIAASQPDADAPNYEASATSPERPTTEAASSAGDAPAPEVTVTNPKPDGLTDSSE